MGHLAIFVFFGNMERKFGLRVLLLDIQKVKYHGGFSPLFFDDLGCVRA